MTNTSKHIFLVAGEVSGDMHAAHLVEAMKAQDSGVTFSGFGGPKMKAAGVEIYEDLTKLAVVGFVEVLKHLFQVIRTYRLILRKVADSKADCVILIDYPGMNLQLAKALKKRHVKVIYYISPQVWAWKEKRVQQIKQYTDRMLVLFEFEKDFYARHGLEVDFVGHPLIDSLKATVGRDQLLQSVDLPLSKLTIGILPGSRTKEIENLFPVMLEAARILNRDHANIQFLLLKAPTIKSDFFESYTENLDIPFRIVDDQTYNGINASDLCIVCSGTATLETAILNKPMVVVYKISYLTYLLAKSFIKIPYIAMANVVAGKKIVPECIQSEASGETIAAELSKIFTDEIKIAEIKSALGKVKASLGQSGASSRAAQRVLQIIG